MIATIIFAVLIAFTIYGLSLALFHMPLYGAFFLIPLFLCMAMVLFMAHGEDKKHVAHKH